MWGGQRGQALTDFLLLFLFLHRYHSSIYDIKIIITYFSFFNYFIGSSSSICFYYFLNCFFNHVVFLLIDFLILSPTYSCRHTELILITSSTPQISNHLSHTLVPYIRFPETSMPGVQRNDLYVTVSCAKFEMGVKKAPRNIQVRMQLCNEDGTEVPCSIILGAGTEPVTIYNSVCMSLLMYIVYIVYCILYIVYIVYCIYCILYIVYCIYILYIIYCILYFFLVYMSSLMCVLYNNIHSK